MAQFTAGRFSKLSRPAIYQLSSDAILQDVTSGAIEIAFKNIGNLMKEFILIYLISKLFAVQIWWVG